jgi:hypothetical protein
MAEFTDAEFIELSRIAKQQAQLVSVRYNGVDQGDTEQEIWVWLLANRQQMRKYLDAGHLGRIAKSFYNAATAYCEREKKATLGYDWRDDYNYSRPEIARILPLALDPTTIPGLSGSGLHDGPSAKSDPAYGGGMLASIVDVRVAYRKLSEADQKYVALVVALDSNWDQVAAHTGMKANSATAKYYRILDRMVTRHLGRKVDDDAA